MPTNYFAPAQDFHGKPLQPVDKVNFKLYPHGLNRGVVIVSDRTTERCGNEWLPSLVILSDANGKTYPIISRGPSRTKGLTPGPSHSNY